MLSVWGCTRPPSSVLTYRLGDQIAWAEHAEGQPGLDQVDVIGVRDWCPICGLDTPDEYCLVRFERDILSLVRVLSPEEAGALLEVERERGW